MNELTREWIDKAEGDYRSRDAFKAMQRVSTFIRPKL